MTYQISLQNTHCSGCFQVIKLFLEDVFGEEKVNVDIEKQSATIQSDKQENDVKAGIDQAFEEMKKNEKEYTYSNLELIN